MNKLYKPLAVLLLISVSASAYAEPEKLPIIKTDKTYYTDLPDEDVPLKIVTHRTNASTTGGTPITNDPSPPGGVDNPDVRPIKPVTAAPISATHKTGKGAVNNNPPPHVPVDLNNDAIKNRKIETGPITTEPVKPPIVEPIVKGKDSPL